MHHPVVGGQFHDDGIGLGDEEGRHQHRQHHRGQYHLHDERIHQLDAARQVQQHEAEFARLRQSQSRAQGHAVAGPEQPGQARDQGKFQQHGAAQQQQDEPPVVEHHADIEQHADGDEEQAQQHVAEGLDILFHLVLEFRLGNEHAGNKRPQGQRQPRPFRDPGRAQGDQQQVEHEQFLRAALGDDGQPATHQLLADEQEQNQDNQGLAAGPGQGFGQVVRIAREGGNQDQQGYHGQVLEQQNADDLAAVFAFQFQPFREHFGDDGR